MKRYLYLAILIILCLFFLSGCIDYNHVKSANEKENLNTSNQSGDIKDLQPTIYKDVNNLPGVTTVSYTHLDVYKRQSIGFMT